MSLWHEGSVVAHYLKAMKLDLQVFVSQALLVWLQSFWCDKKNRSAHWQPLSDSLCDKKRSFYGWQLPGAKPIQPLKLCNKWLHCWLMLWNLNWYQCKVRITLFSLLHKKKWLMKPKYTGQDQLTDWFNAKVPYYAKQPQHNNLCLSADSPEMRKVSASFACSTFQAVCGKTHGCGNRPFVTSQRAPTPHWHLC